MIFRSMNSCLSATKQIPNNKYAHACFRLQKYYKIPERHPSNIFFYVIPRIDGDFSIFAIHIAFLISG